MVCANYGRVTALALDPVEKKPLRRFRPGQAVLSVGSYGCNLSCPFCQNAEIAAAGEEVPTRYLSPAGLAQQAQALIPRGNLGVAYTYNEPLVGYEYVLDCAKEVRARGMENVLVSNGCISAERFAALLRLYGAPLKDAMRVGVPAALQSVMYSASNIVIQAAINSFGTDAVAAWTAYGKMDVIFWMSINAMALAITTFAGQNYGAGQYDRLKKGVRVSVGMSAGFTVLLSTAMTVFARPILSIFSPDPDVLEIGVAMVRFLAPCYITYILVELLPGAIRGAGRSMVPMLISVFGVCVLRLVWLFTVVQAHHTIEAVELSYPITWAVTSAAVLIYYRWGHWLQPRNGTE